MKIPDVSVVMPCLNEEEAIGICIQKIRDIFSRSNIKGEILICDNGSADNSAAIAENMGARMVYESVRGYGKAYKKGFSAALGKYLIMIDADCTYDFNLIPDFIHKLDKEGYDFVTGGRYLSRGGAKNLPFVRRFIGNPILTHLSNYLFGMKYSDILCGFRAFTREAYGLINPLADGFEFNLELAVKAWRANLKITEIPIDLLLRKGKSKLNIFKDGWRCLIMIFKLLFL